MFINCKSWFSLRWGTLSVEALVEAAKAVEGLNTLVLTDINSASACLDFVFHCRKAGIKPVIGMEFRDENHRLLYIGIAKNKEGVRELNRLLTDASLEGEPLPEVAPAFSDAWIIYPFGRRSPKLLAAHEFTGIRMNEVNKLYSSAYKTHPEKLVILHPVTYLNNEGYHLHRLLRAVDLNTLITKLDRADHAQQAEHFESIGTIKDAFKDYPQAISNTQMILDAALDEFDLPSNKNRMTFTGSRYDDKTLLEKLTREGMDYRYPRDKVARARVQKELKVIDELGYSAYFLITWDIIRYARSRGYHHVGRGSGANSIVAYCMGITDVDPIELDLYFERFINPHRTSPPDFDIDFSWDERDEVIDYVFKRYGRQHTALLATYSTFKGASIVRELGKVFGLPKAEIDRLLDQPDHPANKTELVARITAWGKRMEGFPNHLSIHAGGILITEEDINYHTALQMMPKGFPITHFDMHVAEDYGFYKYDILSQRGLGHIKEAAELVLENQKERVDVHDVRRFKQDKRTRDLLRKGDCLGCFYIESPAMRQLLGKLRCDDYLTLVAASSIIRPGVARSGMMKEYIARYHRPDLVEYLHPKMAELLEETFGVMVYQEDVIKVAHHFGGLDLGEADILRRMMSGKSRWKSKYEAIKVQFFENCNEKGYPEAITAEVWRQIESFSGYSFSKAHSASYAVESFQSLYLKAHFPLEFMVAVINNFGGFYRTEVYVHEARKLGGNVEAPCVNNSRYLTSIRGEDIYLGFVHVKGLEKNLARAIVQERFQHGAYRSLEDFLRRVHIGPEQLEMLVRLNALRFTGKPKQQLFLEACLRRQRSSASQSTVLFDFELPEFALPPPDNTDLIDRYDELELIGFPVADPYSMLRTDFRGEVMAEEMVYHIGKVVRMVGYLITYKEVMTINRKLMRFGTFLDAEGGYIDSVHFPPVLRGYPFQGTGFYLLQGMVTEEFGVPNLEVSRMAKLPVKADPRYE